jgi:prepilin-type N-terminal cleavage/methylation domain-containing protein
MMHRGFTLLEILVAITITALLMIAAWTWLVALIRSGQAQDFHQSLVEEAIVVARIMAEDADLADWHGTVVPAEVKEPRMRFQTLCRPTIRESRGWETVTWTWSETTGITRTSGDGPPRLISRRLRCRWYLTSKPIPHAWVAVRPANQSTNALESEWIFPLDAR